MIIQGEQELSIGEPQTVQVSGLDGLYYTIRLVPLRLATLGEYIDYVHSIGHEVQLRKPHGPYFYEVSMD